MKIANNILRYYLRDVYFITGTAYAGKSTTVRMLADRYGMVFCGENYHSAVSDVVATPDLQPDISFLNNLTDWKDFVTRTPEEYERWIYSTGREAAEFEVAHLLSVAGDRKVIVDTNIPLDILREISDYHHVAILLCDPPDITSKLFFDREDPDKKFMMEQIKKCKDPEATLKNFNSWALYHPEEEIDWTHTGFFSYTRSDFEHDTREEMLAVLAEHFRLV